MRARHALSLEHLIIRAIEPVGLKGRLEQRRNFESGRSHGASTSATWTVLKFYNAPRADFFGICGRPLFAVLLSFAALSLIAPARVYLISPHSSSTKDSYVRSD